MSIFSLLSPTAIHPHASAQTSEEIIRILGNSLYDADVVKGDFVQAVLDREDRTPTGLELSGSFNAALPHVDIEYVNKSALALATLDTPVYFQRMENPKESVPVQLVIMLALADPKSQIKALEQIATMLQNPQKIEQIMAAGSVDQILEALKEI